MSVQNSESLTLSCVLSVILSTESMLSLIFFAVLCAMEKNHFSTEQTTVVHYCQWVGGYVVGYVVGYVGIVGYVGKNNEPQYNRGFQIMNSLLQWGLLFCPTYPSI